jgi:hypothetical protein
VDGVVVVDAFCWTSTVIATMVISAGTAMLIFTVLSKRGMPLQCFRGWSPRLMFLPQ